MSQAWRDLAIGLAPQRAGTSRRPGRPSLPDAVTDSLTRSVRFGWGVLGRQEEGGTILVEHIRIDTVMRTSQFRRMRDDLTLEEGLKVLAKEEEDERGEP